MFPKAYMLRLLPWVFLLGIPFLVYAGSLANGFVWDDHGLIEEDPWVHQLRHIPFLFSPDYWTHYFPGIKGQYRPLRAITFALQWAIWGQDPVAFHAFNLLLHLANVCLVYGLLVRLSRRRDVAWLGALLWALHPALTEAVGWVKNRSELLSLFFGLLAFLSYLRWREALSRRSASLNAVSAVGGYLLALLSKEIALVLPLILIVHAFLLDQTPRKALPIPILMLLLTGGYLLLKFLYLQSPEAQPPPPLRWDERFLLIVRTLGIYLVLLLFPLHLNADRPLDLDMLARWDTGLYALVLLLAGVACGWSLWRQHRLAAFGFAWIFLGLVPVSNLIFLHTRPLADQRLYWPSIGFCLLAAILLQGIRRSFPLSRLRRPAEQAAVALMVLMAGLWAVRSIARISVWKDDLTLIQNTLRHSPQSARPHFQMGILLFNRGETEQAAKEFLKALELSPGLYEASNYLGVLYAQKEDYGQAIKWFWRALESNPNSVSVLTNLALALADAGDLDRAHTALRRALDLAPMDPQLWAYLGILQGRRGQYDRALEAFDRALEIAPGYIKARVHRAYAYAALGNLERCVEDLETALSWEPTNVNLYLDLASAYRKKGQPKLALETLRDALSLNPSDARVHNRLGNLLAAQGRVEEAIKHFQKAVELSPNQSLGYYNLGRAYVDAGDPARAETPLKKALEIDPNNPVFHRSLAHVLRKLNRPEEAEKHALKAQELERKTRSPGTQRETSSVPSSKTSNIL